jgi:hypothetical protein
MGFSVRDEETGLEYSGSSLNTLFAQRSNLLSWRFLGMVRDILRFNRQSVADLEEGLVDDAETLGSYLRRNRYSETFQRQYLVAMGSAIWSADCETILEAGPGNTCDPFASVSNNVSIPAALSSASAGGRAVFRCNWPTGASCPSTRWSLPLIQTRH